MDVPLRSIVYTFRDGMFFAYDQYDVDDIDDTDYGNYDPAQRAAVEAKLNRRDAEEARLNRVPAAFLDDYDGEEQAPAGEQRRRRRRGPELQFGMGMGIEEEEREITLDDLKDMKGRSIVEFISMPGPRHTIQREFRHFLLSYVDDKGSSVYGERIRYLGEVNAESLEISYTHLADSKPILAYFLANSPAEMLRLMDTVAFEVVLTMFPDYDRIHAEIHVRISDLPSISSLRDLRQSQLNCLVRIYGVVSRRTGVFPQLKYVKYDCMKCGVVLGPFYQDTQNEIKIGSCYNCQSKGPFSINSQQTVYRNYQKLTLQESPGTVPAGRLPRHRDIILLWDMIDSAKPGEEIEVTGIYRNNFDASLNTKNGFPVFATVIEANHVSKKEDEFAVFRLTEDDQQMIRDLARDERIGKRIVKSIAPSIYGHENIKMALALSMFGGVPKDVRGKLRLRGDINVLMLGDPGTAKSQLLKYVEKTAHRAVFTTGQGASAVGLTASVRKDPVTREWTLEGGALVLADKGVCLIDEFDKMNDSDRTSIHEAMEQQSISISKAGIVTSLQARCAVIAAANPIRGKYNPTIPFSQNVELTEPILSRFDALCVVRDTVDPVRDELLAKFVVQSHIRSHPEYLLELKAQAQAQQMAAENGEDAAMIEEGLELSKALASIVTAVDRVDTDVIPQDVLRKYIMFAKDKVSPKLYQMDQDKIAQLYAELRRESMNHGSIPITVRHIESMVRMSEAHARMHLRDYVRNDDINVAIRVMLESFIGAQKLSVMKGLRRSFAKYVNHGRDNDELLYYLLCKMLKEKLTFHQYRNDGSMPTELTIPLVEFENQAKDLQINDPTDFYQTPLFVNNGFILDREAGTLIKQF
ncbi:MCM2/3/5 family-domain-containing protein [Dimargaris cristalligena]|uniref:DNA replication licensing factor MCM2 n=1 Tax=Dimargaris cristalligena TaxID=215637 RepID=A0A4V1J3Y1_9FUNG|nr:MCM2/3/5 family-domain-containing protein [Dimargaris cristalligena]|eukprot:RKP33639.1 MCM2/3/5 family-domain-containing protein [Dimargaris cristalligena]